MYLLTNYTCILPRVSTFCRYVMCIVYYIQTKIQISLLQCFSMGQKNPNCPFPWGDMGHYRIYIIPWAYPSPQSNRHIDQFSRFCRAYWQTQRPHYNCSKRPHLCTPSCNAALFTWALIVRWKVSTVESSFDIPDVACELQQYSVIYIQVTQINWAQHLVKCSSSNYSPVHVMRTNLNFKSNWTL